MEAVKLKAVGILNELREVDFHHCFSQWKICMERCRDCQGEYIEGHGPLTFAIPVKDYAHHYLVSYNNEIILIYWNAETDTNNHMLLKYDEIKLPPHEAINYGIADPFGGLCFWTAKVDGSNTGKVFFFHLRYRTPRVIELIIPGIPLSNGIVWHLNDRTKIYYCDGMNNRILSYGYDPATRRIIGNNGIAFDLDVWIRKRKRPLYKGHAMLGRMTIDIKGRLYVPLYGGSHVLQIDPHTQGVLHTIHIPAVKVTACVFGGKDLNILYVSSMRCATNEKCPATDQGGKIFAVPHLDDEMKGEKAMPFVLPYQPQ
ncbi:putative sugar lactone lactonase YvrE [Belonocnema kinseyi]|uniref:putative sugar lactone lactonase YvrE n=1 Tax=Belonocnema kinseyi TaxID=2817044 RepID=UPI00143CF226|nr:putative sugar lactone lactonase YvrE [Belonocnema kinseyi]